MSTGLHTISTHSYVHIHANANGFAVNANQDTHVYFLSNRWLWFARFLWCHENVTWIIFNRFWVGNKAKSFMYIIVLWGNYYQWCRTCPFGFFHIHPNFQVIELVHSWINLDFRVSKTHISFTWISKLTKDFLPSWKSKFHNLSISTTCFCNLVVDEWQ